jgi:L-seryl-tRNA(Ser) seleniumtransferase
MARPELVEAIEARGRETVVSAVRAVLEEVRTAIARGIGSTAIPDEDAIIRSVSDRLAQDRPSLRPVVNATGILLHTGLGRAPLAREAVEAVARVAGGYSNLEFALDQGTRGRRSSGVSALLRRLTGAEAAAVVNNNAGATMLALRALASGREVIVSRGQLVEIGGSYRLPEVFESSGARLREVGTTNKTRLGDYERAIGPETRNRSGLPTWPSWGDRGGCSRSTTSARGRSGRIGRRGSRESRPWRRRSRPGPTWCSARGISCWGGLSAGC